MEIYSIEHYQMGALFKINVFAVAFRVVFVFQNRHNQHN